MASNNQENLIFAIPMMGFQLIKLRRTLDGMALKVLSGDFILADSKFGRGQVPHVDYREATAERMKHTFGSTSSAQTCRAHHANRSFINEPERSADCK